MSHSDFEKSQILAQDTLLSSQVMISCITFFCPAVVVGKRYQPLSNQSIWIHEITRVVSGMLILYGRVDAVCFISGLFYCDQNKQSKPPW